jgi:hypothetical protein
LSDHIPGDAILYIGWQGTDAPGSAYDGSHTQAILDASQLRQFLNESFPKLIDRVAQQDKDAADILQTVMDLSGTALRHPTALYFGGMDATGGQPMPKVAWICDAGSDAAALTQKINDLLAKGGPGVPFKCATVGQTVVVSIAPMAEHPDNPLSANKDFTAVIGQLNQQPMGVFYMNGTAAWAFVDQMMQMAPPEAQQHWPQLRDALGLSGVKAIAATCGFDGKNWSSQLMVAAPQPRSGALAAMTTEPLADDLINLIPQSSTMAGAGSFDVAGFVAGILNLVQQLHPDVAVQVQQGIAQANQMLGIDIQKDFLGSFGTQWAYYTDPTAIGNGLMGLTIMNRPKNAAQLQAALEKIEGFANAMLLQQLQQAHVTVAFRQTTVNNTTVHYLATPLFSPAWAIQNGTWYWGLFPDVPAAALKRPAGGPSIHDNPAYQQVMKELGAPNQVQSFSFVDLPKTVPMTYQALIMISRLYGGLGDLAGMESPAMLLPPLDVLEAQTEPAGAIAWSDDAGFHAKAIAPYPGAEALASGQTMSPAMVGEGALMASVMLPSMNRARSTANRVKSASNMRQIGQAILLYSNDNNGAYPPDLGTLIKTENIAGEAFINPNESNQLPPDWANLAPDDKVKWVNENADYVYVGAGMKQSDPNLATAIVAYEKSDNKGDGKNILYGDGHIEFQNLAAARQQIESTGKATGGGL